MAIDVRQESDEEFAKRSARQSELKRINDAERETQLDEDGNSPTIFGPPPKGTTCVKFWPKALTGIDKHYEGELLASMRHRCDVLLGLRNPRDGFDQNEWNKSEESFDDPKPFPSGLLFNVKFGQKDDGRKPFKIVPSAFIQLARENPPDRPEATVSAFASWIYSLYSNAYGDDDDKQRGKDVEPRIFQQRMRAEGGVNNAYLNSIGSDWRLVHNGLHMPGDEIRKWFTIDTLRVNGEAMRALPDLIYRNQRWNEVIIVEIKHSFMKIPSNLWPNIWAQLWCYAQLEGSLRAEKLTVVGEVWGERKYWMRGERGGAGRDMLHLRASERRDPRAPAYDRFFRTLFDIYSAGKN